MKTQSDNKLPLAVKLQGGGLINFNEQVVNVPVMPGQPEKTAFEYDQVKVSDQPTKGEIVSAIIRSKYSSDDELAIIHNGNDTPAHETEMVEFMAFRVEAKVLAVQALSMIS